VSSRASSFTGRQQVQSTASASKIGAQKDASQRAGPGSGGGGQVDADPAGKGLAWHHYPTKRTARPASAWRRPRGHRPLVPPGLPTSRRRSGVGVVARQAAGAHHSHSHAPAPLPSNTWPGGVPRVPAIKARSRRSLLRIQGLQASTGAVQGAGTVTVSAAACIGIRAPGCGTGIFDPVLNHCLLEVEVIEAPQLRYTQGQPDPCGRNVRCSSRASAARRPVRPDQGGGAGAIWPRISRKGSRWASG